MLRVGQAGKHNPGGVVIIRTRGIGLNPLNFLKSRAGARSLYPPDQLISASQSSRMSDQKGEGQGM